MRRLSKVQGASASGVRWAKKADLVDWFPFSISTMIEVTTKFGAAYELTLTHMETGEIKSILLAQNPMRTRLFEYFCDLDAAPLGPCKLVMGEKAWMVVEPDVDLQLDDEYEASA